MAWFPSIFVFNSRQTPSGDGRLNVRPCMVYRTSLLLLSCILLVYHHHRWIPTDIHCVMFILSWSMVPPFIVQCSCYTRGCLYRSCPVSIVSHFQYVFNMFFWWYQLKYWSFSQFHTKYSLGEGDRVLRSTRSPTQARKQRWIYKSLYLHCFELKNIYFTPCFFCISRAGENWNMGRLGSGSVKYKITTFKWENCIHHQWLQWLNCLKL